MQIFHLQNWQCTFILQMSQMENSLQNVCPYLLCLGNSQKGNNFCVNPGKEGFCPRRMEKFLLSQCWSLLVSGQLKDRGRIDATTN